MSRATSLPPARTLAVFAAATLVALAAVLSFGAASAEAATPCWKRALDEWSDNGHIDDVYSRPCIQAATTTSRRICGSTQRPGDHGQRAPALRPRPLAPGTSGSPPSAKAPTRTVTPVEPEVESETGPRDEGPIPYVLGQGTTDASSIPVPLMILAGLALALMAAGAAGFTHRKLKARRIASGE